MGAELVAAVPFSARVAIYAAAVLLCCVFAAVGGERIYGGHEYETWGGGASGGGGHYTTTGGEPYAMRRASTSSNNHNATTWAADPPTVGTTWILLSENGLQTGIAGDTKVDLTFFLPDFVSGQQGGQVINLGTHDVLVRFQSPAGAISDHSFQMNFNGAAGNYIGGFTGYVPPNSKFWVAHIRPWPGLTSPVNAGVCVAKMKINTSLATGNYTPLFPGEMTGPGAPPAPTNVAWSSGGVLSWAASSGATSYKIYRDGAEVASGITSLSYTPTPTPTNGSYTVRAVSAAGTSADSAAAVWPIPPPPPPTTPQSLAWTASPPSLGWQSVSGATGYRVYLDGQLYVNNLTSNSWTPAGTPENGNYTVRAFNGSGESGASNIAPWPIPTGQGTGGDDFWDVPGSAVFRPWSWSNWIPHSTLPREKDWIYGPGWAAPDVDGTGHTYRYRVRLVYVNVGNCGQWTFGWQYEVVDQATTLPTNDQDFANTNWDRIGQGSFTVTVGRNGYLQVSTAGWLRYMAFSETNTLPLRIPKGMLDAILSQPEASLSGNWSAPTTYGTYHHQPRETFPNNILRAHLSKLRNSFDAKLDWTQEISRCAGEWWDNKSTGSGSGSGGNIEWPDFNDASAQEFSFTDKAMPTLERNQHFSSLQDREIEHDNWPKVFEWFPDTELGQRALTVSQPTDFGTWQWSSYDPLKLPSTMVTPPGWVQLQEYVNTKAGLIRSLLAVGVVIVFAWRVMVLVGTGA